VLLDRRFEILLIKPGELAELIVIYECHPDLSQTICPRWLSFFGGLFLSFLQKSHALLDLFVFKLAEFLCVANFIHLVAILIRFFLLVSHFLPPLSQHSHYFTEAFSVFRSLFTNFIFPSVDLPLLKYK
jgi:hypothetical protein